MTLRIPAKVLLHVWSYDFYDMTLSTGKQRRHMINGFCCLNTAFDQSKTASNSYEHRYLCKNKQSTSLVGFDVAPRIGVASRSRDLMFFIGK